MSRNYYEVPWGANDSGNCNSAIGALRHCLDCPPACPFTGVSTASNASQNALFLASSPPLLREIDNPSPHTDCSQHVIDIRFIHFSPCSPCKNTPPRDDPSKLQQEATPPASWNGWNPCPCCQRRAHCPPVAHGGASYRRIRLLIAAFFNRLDLWQAAFQISKGRNSRTWHRHSAVRTKLLLITSTSAVARIGERPRRPSTWLACTLRERDNWPIGECDKYRRIQTSDNHEFSGLQLGALATCNSTQLQL